MPQMFPLMWFSLFLSIFFTLLVMVTMTHFSSNNLSLEILSSPKLTSSLNWKW